jgi:aryl-alcohol dehydrogenase-like predicted oxidoreductase
MQPNQTLIPLGKTNIQISALGIGTWQWGDRLMWGYGRGYQESDIQEAFNASLEVGVNFFDTAEIYGNGVSERMLGSFLAGVEKKLVVATKFMPLPWRLTKGAFLRALKNSLKRLNLEKVDLYQIHHPLLPVSIETLAEWLADAVQTGLVSAVGVSNYNVDQMRRTYAILTKRGVPLASNQVEYSLVNRRIEFAGLLSSCQDLGITLLAYSPLAKGALTGKYSVESLPPGMRSRRYSRTLFEQIEPLVKVMREVGREQGGKTLAQVALNWCISKGTVPLAGVKNIRQARDNCAALEWRLSEAQVAALDQASENL